MKIFRSFDCRINTTVQAPNIDFRYCQLLQRNKTSCPKTQYILKGSTNISSKCSGSLFCCQTTTENDLCVIVLVQTLCPLLFIWLFIYLKSRVSSNCTAECSLNSSCERCNIDFLCPVCSIEFIQAAWHALHSGEPSHSHLPDIRDFVTIHLPNTSD